MTSPELRRAPVGRPSGDERRSRMRFLAQAAAQIAAGYTANQETSGQDSRRIARDAFDIAKAILDCATEWLADQEDREKRGDDHDGVAWPGPRGGSKP